jgi:hypothetical protein
VTVNQEGSKSFVVVAAYDPQSGNLIDGNATNLAYGSLYRIRIYVTNSGGLANPTGPPSPLCETVNPMTCPTGTIALTDSGQPLDQGTFTLNNNGYTRDLQTTLLAGVHSLVAQYTGDSSYSGSTSDAHALTITPAATTAGVPYIPYSPVIVGTPVSISTIVFTNVYNGAAPTGTVTFFDGATPISGTVSYTPMAATSSFAAELRAQIHGTLTTSGTHAITVSGQLSKSEHGRTVVSVGGARGEEDIPELGKRGSKFDGDEGAFGVEDWRTHYVSLNLFLGLGIFDGNFCSRG